MEKFELESESKDQNGDNQSSQNEMEEKNSDSASSLKSGKDLKVWMAIMFITGALAGSGALALPRAVVKCGGPLGIAMLLLFGGIVTYAGIIIGRCWLIVESRHEEYRDCHVQDPYSVIGYVAAGNVGRYVATICCAITNFAIPLILLILSSDLIRGLLHQLVPSMTLCEWILVVGAVHIPLSWLGTPKDMWPIGVGATITTLLACILLTTNLMLLIPKTAGSVEHRNVELEPFMSAFGIMAFALNCHSTFPTIQNDMADKKAFPLALTLGYIIMFSMFLPVILSSYFVIGDYVGDNVLTTLQRLNQHGQYSWMSNLASVLMASHLILAFHILLNPLSQDLEKIFKVKNEFGYPRLFPKSLTALKFHIQQLERPEEIQDFLAPLLDSHTL